MQCIAQETWRQIQTAHASGIPLRELARRMGIAEGTILSRAKRESWSLQIAQARLVESPQLAREIAQQPQPGAITPLEAVVSSIAENKTRFRTHLSSALAKAAKHTDEQLAPGELVDKAARLNELASAAGKLYGDSEQSGAFQQLIQISVTTE